MGRRYDESGFEQLLGWDPRLVIPGGMLAAISVALTRGTWPDLWPGLMLLGIAVGLITLGLNVRMGVRVEPGRFLVIWRVAALRYERAIRAHEAQVRYRRCRRGPWTILVGRGWWTYETFLYLRSEIEAQEWVAFLQEVAAGRRPEMPGKGV